MGSKLMLSFTAGAAVMLLLPTTQTVWAQGEAALTGTVSSDAYASPNDGRRRKFPLQPQRA
jgi:hypothetical protein